MCHMLLYLFPNTCGVVESNHIYTHTIYLKATRSEVGPKLVIKLLVCTCLYMHRLGQFVLDASQIYTLK